ncbi:hypothetical protein EF901_16235 [Staphylococcus aureus]|nr:hypothetical protein EF901_16235 [Staphylococcus aureus]
MHSLKGQFVDFDNMYAYQCADLSVDFIYHVTGGVRFYGNAKELHTLNAMPKGSRKLIRGCGYSRNVKHLE